MLANLSPSPRGPHLFPGFGSVGEHFFVCATAHVNRDSNTNMPFRPFFYLAPGPGYDVFMKVHVAYQTCLNFFSRCRADLKATSQRPVGLEAKKTCYFVPSQFLSHSKSSTYWHHAQEHREVKKSTELKGVSGTAIYLVKEMSGCY